MKKARALGEKWYPFGFRRVLALAVGGTSMVLLGYAVSGPTLKSFSEPPIAQARTPVERPRDPALTKSFDVGTTVKQDTGGRAQLLLNLSRNRMGAFAIVASATVVDDRGNVVVDEVVTSRRDLPPEASAHQLVFELPSLSDGFYRAPILIAWRQEGLEDTVTLEDVYLQSRQGRVTRETLDSWGQQSLVRYARKKEGN
jgi:hypothetical protein